MNLFLFDVDGVLVYDHAYRIGVTAVLNYFGRLMALAAPVIDEAAIEAMHAHSYTNEWDMVPFGLGVMLIKTLRAPASPPIVRCRPDRVFKPNPGGLCRSIPV